MGKKRKPAGIIKRAGVTDDRVTRDISEVLIKVAMRGHLETCPLCGMEVVSVALHFIVCPRIKESREGG